MQEQFSIHTQTLPLLGHQARIGLFIHMLILPVAAATGCPDQPHRASHKYRLPTAAPGSLRGCCCHGFAGARLQVGKPVRRRKRNGFQEIRCIKGMIDDEGVMVKPAVIKVVGVGGGGGNAVNRMVEIGLKVRVCVDDRFVM